jgi:hypothetical protein
VSYSQGQGDDGAARILFAVPDTYLATFTHPEGGLVGTVKAKAVLGDQGGAVVDLGGQVVAAVAATPLTAGGTVASAAAACNTGSAAHQAYWLLNLTGSSGQALQVPVVIDNTLQNAVFSQFSAFAITVCLPPAGVPAGTAGRAPLGAKVISLDLTLPDVFTVLSGEFAWHMLVTPYAAGSATVNTSGAVEADSVDLVPPALTLSAKRVKVTKKAKNTVRRATVSGRLTAGGHGVGARQVQVFAGKKLLGSAKTNAAGRFSVTLAYGSARTVRASAKVPIRPLTCSAPVFAPAPCSGSSYGAFTVATEAVAIG